MHRALARQANERSSAPTMTKQLSLSLVTEDSLGHSWRLIGRVGMAVSKR
jgi:1,2-phenylacetyl-CoA epoxidase catalytic subunit